MLKLLLLVAIQLFENYQERFRPAVNENEHNSRIVSEKVLIILVILPVHKSELAVV